MKKLSLLFALLLMAGAASAADFSSTGVGVGVLVPSADENPCPGSELLCNDDGGFENGYAWQYGGIVAPDYGAFAEGYEITESSVCGVQLKLTQVGNFVGQSCDVYVWDSDGTNPNNVLAVATGVVVSAPAQWPSISNHDVDTPDIAEMTGGVFVGYWGNWPGAGSGYYVAADQDGFGGLPRTNIAPGIGYPTGWNDPSVVWGTTQALGLCAYVSGEPPIPVENATWGEIKNLYK